MMGWLRRRVDWFYLTGLGGLSRGNAGLGLTTCEVDLEFSVILTCLQQNLITVQTAAGSSLRRVSSEPIVFSI